MRWDFLNKGKYAMEFLKRFEMLDCKAISTLMVSNLNLMLDTTSEIMDSTLYTQIVDSLMYLTNTRPDMCFVVNTPGQFGCSKTYVDVP